MYDFFPFSGVGFFIISFSFILFLHIFKNILSKFISYKMVIFIAVVVYISFAIPDSYLIFLLLIYTYVIYYIFVKKTTFSTHIILQIQLMKSYNIFYQLQNVTIGSNLRYNKVLNKWENIGSPILAENVIVADGAKILGPILIGENSVVGAGAIITKNIPTNSIAYGVNQYKTKNPDYDLVFSSNMIASEEIMRIDKEHVIEFNKSREIKDKNWE